MTSAPAPTLEAAYRHCAEVTRTEARNFSWGIRLLPPPQRDAMCAIYALARRIDDIGDGDLPVPEKLSGLQEVRRSLQATDAVDPVLAAVLDTARRFPVPLEAFADLVDGVEMDVRGERYPDFDTLVVYCRRVAGSVGRLSLGVYGTSDRRASALADDLGVALQQTNVLRDVREDLLRGRVYLPADELEAAGVVLEIGPTGRLRGPAPALLGVLRAAAGRAETWYADGLRLLATLDRRPAACTAAMAGIYRRLNRRIHADPAPVLERRMSLPAWEKAAVALQAIGRPGRLA